MRICLICEGCYPYITGGVSSWIQTVCSEFSDIDFIICSIATTKAEMSKIHYDLPESIKEIRTIYLGEKNFDKKSKTVRLTKKDKETLRDMMIEKADGSIDWKKCLEFIKKYQTCLEDILMSEAFFEVCLEEYNRKKMKKNFFQFLWNIRSMYFPFMNILSGEIPDADIYHSVSTGYAGILGSCASYVNEKPFLLTEHGIYTREREEDIIRSQWVHGDFKEVWIDFFKKLSYIAYRQATVVTSLFEVNKTLQIELGCPEEKIRVIPNGVSIETFKTPQSKQLTDPKRFNIGTILRVVPIKDVKTMILSFASVKENIPNAKLYIMGNCDENPEYYQECLTLVKDLHIQDIEFLGQVNIQDYFPKIDLLLLTSISEGQPLAMLEGMAAGLPFVSTNVGDCRALLEGNGKGDDKEIAGIIVPVMNSDALAHAIVYCYEHPDQRKRMGEVGRKRVEKFYRKEEFLKQYREIYNQIGGNCSWQV